MNTHQTFSMKENIRVNFFQQIRLNKTVTYMAVVAPQDQTAATT